ncbi:hypothetical protein TNCV_2703751 [Trichonephila clavipes]|nr:hypothetical protein TNCV_2703751 [Trichonephila clavipes]
MYRCSDIIYIRQQQPLDSDDHFGQAVREDLPSAQSILRFQKIEKYYLVRFSAKIEHLSNEQPPSRLSERNLVDCVPPTQKKIHPTLAGCVLLAVQRDRAKEKRFFPIFPRGRQLSSMDAKFVLRNSILPRESKPNGHLRDLFHAV